MAKAKKKAAAKKRKPAVKKKKAAKKAVKKAAAKKPAKKIKRAAVKKAATKGAADYKLLNLKTSSKERKAISDMAKRYAKGNVSAWLRYAGANCRPGKDAVIR